MVKGILSKAESIKAIVEGRKTQTRRVVNFRKVRNNPISSLGHGGIYSIGDSAREHELITKGLLEPNISLSRYQVGEVVYVKEAHYRYGHWNRNGFTKTGERKWLFKAETLEVRYLENRPSMVYANSIKDRTGWFKRSPLFMPEWAARYFIKITGVRAERLQEITEEDAIAEGMQKQELAYDIAPVWQYQELWDSTNPKYPWEMNPWVWVYSFEKV